MKDDSLPLFGPADELPRPPFPAAAPADAPLAERMRPTTLDQMLGHPHLVGEAGLLRELIATGHLPSLILHGPPGTGKTTLARLIAEEIGARFVAFSAVGEGVPRLREVVGEAEALRGSHRRTLLFVDEIHRLNRAQQDFLLPHVESGLLTLIGATTEHPAFEVNAALLSRARVLRLDPLAPEALGELLQRALTDRARGLGAAELSVSPEAAALFVEAAAGDARHLLVSLELAAGLVGSGGTIAAAAAGRALQQRTPRYDASVAAQALSAFHKSLRGSSVEGALYWALRMIEAGEDPKTLFRRLIAAAYEDVGLADPQAGVVAVQAMQAFERLGTPEGLLPLANAVIYVAQAPKSNRAYLGLHAATDAARAYPAEPVPLHLRNAHTGLMREWGYGAGYKYAHHFADAHVEQQFLPDALQGARWYTPTDQGFEQQVAERFRQREGTR